MNGYTGSLKWWNMVVNLLAVDTRPHLTASSRSQPVVSAEQRAPVSSKTSAIEKLAGQPVGRKLKIVGFTLPPDIYQRLLEMGLTKGTACTVVRYAPMGDPIELKVRGYSLSLRLAEAAGVQVSCH